VVAGVIEPKVGEYYDPSREHGFHALCHAYASWLLANGVDIRSLADYLGHADPVQRGEDEEGRRPRAGRCGRRPSAVAWREIRRRSSNRGVAVTCARWRRTAS